MNVIFSQLSYLFIRPCSNVICRQSGHRIAYVNILWKCKGCVKVILCCQYMSSCDVLTFYCVLQCVKCINVFGLHHHIWNSTVHKGLNWLIMLNLLNIHWLKNILCKHRDWWSQHVCYVCIHYIIYRFKILTGKHPCGMELVLFFFWKLYQWRVD